MLVRFSALEVPLLQKLSEAVTSVWCWGYQATILSKCVVLYLMSVCCCVILYQCVLLYYILSVHVVISYRCLLCYILSVCVVLNFLQMQRLPCLPSSNILLDTLTGRDEMIGFEDVLNGETKIIHIHTHTHTHTHTHICTVGKQTVNHYLHQQGRQSRAVLVAAVMFSFFPFFFFFSFFFFTLVFLQGMYKDVRMLLAHWLAHTLTCTPISHAHRGMHAYMHAHTYRHMHSRTHMHLEFSYS